MALNLWPGRPSTTSTLGIKLESDLGIDIIRTAPIKLVEPHDIAYFLPVFFIGRELIIRPIIDDILEPLLLPATTS